MLTWLPTGKISNKLSPVHYRSLDLLSRLPTPLNQTSDVGMTHLVCGYGQLHRAGLLTDALQLTACPSVQVMADKLLQNVFTVCICAPRVNYRYRCVLFFPDDMSFKGSMPFIAVRLLRVKTVNILFHVLFTVCNCTPFRRMTRSPTLERFWCVGLLNGIRVRFVDASIL